MAKAPLRDLYPRITAFSTLLAAFRKASKGKRYRPDVLAFGSNLEAELFQLQNELRSFTYAPGSYRQFMVREPKARLVSAAPFRDRVVHHALIAVIAPPLERHFLPTSYANRKGYGTHRALRRFVRACAEHAWVLQADIRLYFPSIDHRLLIAQLERLIACPASRTCLRYVDDVALFADRPDPLQQALVVLRADLAELRLRFHPSKTHLHRTAAGASFVGFHLIGGRIRLRNHSLLRIRRGLRRCARGLVTRRLRIDGARASATSWNAHLAHGHTLQLRRRLFARYPFCAGLLPSADLR